MYYNNIFAMTAADPMSSMIASIRSGNVALRKVQREEPTVSHVLS